MGGGSVMDERIVYGTVCTWWDSIDKVGRGIPFGLPCCPHCGGPLLEVSNEQVWFNAVDAHEKNGHPLYRKFIEWQRGKCYKNTEAARQAYEVEVKEKVSKPTIVCLCGSTRFKEAFDNANYQETMAGKIVLSVGFFMHTSGNRHGEDIGATPEQKIALDELHKRKIDLADEVLILNVNGYIGDSTKSELTYAQKHSKIIRWLEVKEMENANI